MKQHIVCVNFLLGDSFVLKFITLYTLLLAYNSSVLSQLPTDMHISECEIIGFKNATKNECGYCVGGFTSLPYTYGIDCHGVCGGPGVLDCNDTCNGRAYIDECTGICLGGDTMLGESDLEFNKRDCRGLCKETPASPYNFDACGICSLKPQSSSKFRDCTKTCYAPGNYQQMAKYLCEKCVAGTSSVMITDVLDGCGNCVGSGIPCPCNGTGEEDVCGVCNGDGSSCIKLTGVRPLAAPSNLETEVVISGAFEGKTGKVSCVFKTPDGTRLMFMNGESNGTTVICNVQLDSGEYEIGLSVNRNRINFAEKTVFLVYNNGVGYEKMSPESSFYKYMDIKNTSVRVTFSGGSVPEVMLYCLVTGPEWPTESRVIIGNPNVPHTCDLPLPSSSQNITVTPSLDGQHELSKGFPFTFYAGPPEVGEAYTTEDGSTVTVVFDRPVSIIEFQECRSVLTSETIQFLGEGTLCKWATKNQLVISAEKYINANSVTVSFLSEVLKEDDQKITVPNSVNLVVRAPKVHTTSKDYLKITGPTTVPQCGEFLLVSHFSSLKGGAVSYGWEVVRADNQRVQPEVYYEVKGQKTPYLVLLADKLKLGTDYLFILIVTSPTMSSLRAEHRVTRVSYDAPVVSLYTSLSFSENSVSVNEELHLYGEVTLPSCIKPPKPVRFAWAVNNPRVKFDFGSLYVPVYKAAAFTLPVGETVTFTLRTFLDTAMNESTFAFVTVQVVPQPIQAIIKGEPEVTVGSRSGTILLDGSESGEFGIPVVYQWSCHDKNNEPCYNMLETSQNNSLLSREEQRKPVLKFLSSQLESGRKLRFNLQVFSARNSKVKSNTTLDLNVVDKDIPQVWLQSVSVRGEPIRRRNPVNGVFTVPARMPVIIKATVNSMKRAIQTLSWNITGFPRSFHYNDLKGSTKGETILTLPQGTVVEHGVYVIDLKACDTDGVCGTTNLTLYAFPVVVLCHVYIEPYVAYGWTQAVVRACSVPTERTPLTYQLHMQSSAKLIPVTSLQFSYVFRFIGLPSPANSSAVVYTAKVCDRFGVCQWFRSNPVQVTPPANVTQSANTLYVLSKQAQETGSPLQALTFLSLAASALNRNLTAEESHQAIGYLTEIIAYQPITTGDASVILNSISSLLLSGDQALRLKAITAVARTILKTKTSEKNPSVTVIQEAFSLVTNAIKLYEDDPKTLQKLAKVHHQLTKVAAALLTAGQKLELETKDENLPKAALQYMMLDKDSRKMKVGGYGGNDSVEGTVEFSTEVQNRFKQWKCETKKCQGVALSMRLYHNPNPFPEDPVFRRVAPVVVIQLQMPGTGKVIQLNNVPDLMIIKLSQTVNTSGDDQFTPKCHFWSSSEKAWKTDGLKTLGSGSGKVFCKSNHLTAFTVLEVPIGLSSAAVAGIVVGSLVIVLIVGVVVTLLVRKKNARVSKVNSEQVSVGKDNE